MTNPRETHLKSLATRRRNIDADIARVVAELRYLDRSWSQIAALLGCTRQAAQQTFGPWIEDGQRGPAPAIRPRVGHQ